jgi:hypothetical protein
MLLQTLIVYTKVKIALHKSLADEHGQFAIDMVIGVVVSIILAAFIVMPSMEGLFESMVTSLVTWWGNLETTLFRTT